LVISNRIDIFKSAGSRNVVKQGYGAHASYPKQYVLLTIQQCLTRILQ